MKHQSKGINHVTAIAGNARRNLDFYTQMLGLRQVKKIVNFDDPVTFHFYFTNETGYPGTIMTFFLERAVCKAKEGQGR